MDWGILSKKKNKQEEFLYYLKEWNKVHNLTGIKDFSLWWSHHIQDSLSTLEYLKMVVLQILVQVLEFLAYLSQLSLKIETYIWWKA